MIDLAPQPLELAISHDYRRPRRAELSGGDVVAIEAHSNGSTALLVADVSAKGSEGDAFAAWLATVFRIATRFVLAPGDVLEHLNRAMCDAFADPARGLFASAFVCRFFPLQQSCVYSIAGAEPAILFNDVRPPRHLHGNGMVLGVDKRARYRDWSLNVTPDDALIAFTDGVIDSKRLPALGKLGMEGLLEAVVRASHEAGIPTSHDVLAAVDRLNSGIYRDDATLLVARLSRSHNRTTPRLSVQATGPLQS